MKNDFIHQLISLENLLLSDDMIWYPPSEQDDFNTISKAYRKAINIFSPYKDDYKTDDISAEDFKLITNTVTTTLKGLYMEYRKNN